MTGFTAYDADRAGEEVLDTVGVYEYSQTREGWHRVRTIT